jgi:hypothetical protein
MRAIESSTYQNVLVHVLIHPLRSKQLVSLAGYFDRRLLEGFRQHQMSDSCRTFMLDIYFDVWSYELQSSKRILNQRRGIICEVLSCRHS